MFEIGHEYTRDEIHAELGGSKVSYLPTMNGRVVAACLTRDLNPRAPHVVICGNGPQISSAGRALASQSHGIPVFLKLAVNRWEFQGLFRPIRSHTSGPDFDRLLANSGRPRHQVTRVVEMEAM
jgi:hypothetical protein